MVGMNVPPYAELQVTSNYTFLTGAAHPDELITTAAAMGHAAIAITDRNSFAGIVRAHTAMRADTIRASNLQFIVGVRLDLTDGASLLAYPTDRAAYGRLCQLLTRGKRRGEKAQCHITIADVLAFQAGCLFAILPTDFSDPSFINTVRTMHDAVGNRLFIVAHRRYMGDDHHRLGAIMDFADHMRLSVIATNDVHMHTPKRRALCDVLTCIRHGLTLSEAGYMLHANAERYIKSPIEMMRLFAKYPDAIHNTMRIAQQCTFSLDELVYQYPDDPISEFDTQSTNGTPQDVLTDLTWRGATTRYPGGIPDKVRTQITHELTTIGNLNYAPYFLTVYDIVCFAKQRHILCQGRGSAANSAVCFCLGITSVNPDHIDLLFERFISASRNEPPDIDMDFEHERREEVIQYIYQKYGRDRAGLAATVISYRSRSAVRDVGKVLGLTADTIDKLAQTIWGQHGTGVDRQHVQDELGLDPDEPALRRTIEITRQLIGFPRHLSQHVGGFVITRDPLEQLVPISNAAMEDRTVIEWDKDDIDALGILKIDILALGMLTCIRKALDMIHQHGGPLYTLASLPQEDPNVYRMLSKGDSLGVFQVESRAQMSMLPRLKPSCFYDLVIEVAIVRPGPIQGDMVHPYLKRRQKKEKVTFPSKALEAVLQRTLGVPLFQEQAMKVAIVGAGFTADQADKLRKAMATFRRNGQLSTLKQQFIGGMVERGYTQDFAERCFKQIEGFGEYGFPESHAASFALLVYASAWLKRYHPAAFAAALLNSQPMGFYAPSQIVRDATDHGVTVLPLDINSSHWDHTLERQSNGNIALRLGLRQIKGFRQDAAERIIAMRGKGYASPQDLWLRTGLNSGPRGRGMLELLACADAFASKGFDQRKSLWAVRGLMQSSDALPLFAKAQTHDLPEETHIPLPKLSLGQQVTEDYKTLRLSLKSHPVGLLRARLAQGGAVTSAAMTAQANNSFATVAGLVLVRQRPSTAKGVIFLTIEDESGAANVVVWAKTFDLYRRPVMTARLLMVSGQVQREDEVVHLVARSIVDITDLLDTLQTESSHQSSVMSANIPAVSMTKAIVSRNFH